jgi:hypothetical protein
VWFAIWVVLREAAYYCFSHQSSVPPGGASFFVAAAVA